MEQLSHFDFAWTTVERLLEITKENKTMEQNKELTFGQKAVGLTFNPSGDDKVAKAKQLFADVIDMICPDGERDLLELKLGVNWDISLPLIFRTGAFNAIIAAQMAVVKYLTWKH